MSPNYLNCWNCDGYLGVRPHPFTQKRITGFFGPPFIECKRCGAFTETENLEWPQISVPKQRFVLLGCIVFCLTVVSSGAFLLAFLAERHFDLTVETQVAVYLILYVAGAGAIIAWQVRNISESVRRYEAEKRRPAFEERHDV